MKIRTLAALIASTFAFAACSPQPAPAPTTPAPAPEQTSAASAATPAASAPAEASKPAAQEAEVAAADLPVIDAITTHAPQVPPPIDRNHAARVKVKIEVAEKVMRLADGVEYKFWTFGGQVPGQMIRVREGDIVDVEFANRSDSTVPHNIDFHAPVGMHIANGMYGLILVEPKGGLPKVDKEFYVVQGDFYTKGKYGEAGLQPFDMEKAIKEQPEYVVFNGNVGSIAGDNALKANVGDTVRIFVGNGGPNLVSSFHVIGEIFDRVHVEGGDLINKNVQTTIVPAGGAAIVEFKIDVPGTYNLVDHSIFRTFNKGALGQIKAEGAENKDIFSGKITEGIYQSEGGAIQTSPLTASESEKVAAGPTKASNKEERIKLGEAVFKANCIACHGVEGKGVEGAFPPLAESDYLNADHNRGIQAVTKGLSGEITVNGKKFNSVMAPLALKDDDVANVLTFVLNSFGNKGGEVTPEQVAAGRK